MDTPILQSVDIKRFATFELNLNNGELRKRGHRIALQEQPLRVLTALLERPGEVVTREELRRRLWPGGTFVDFEHSLNAAVRRLRVALRDQADVPRFIETVHKRGYRFLALDNHTPPAIARAFRLRTRLAVVPFGPRDRFSDGLTQEAITQLMHACPHSVGIIARASVERAQRDGGGAAEIGRVLDADYLVEGDVRREGDRLRITAQLIASQDETHVWANTFDRVMIDALALQTEIAEAIAKAVTDALSTSERASA
jgi:TolB-like protein/DNA-binding winged helix-turn-helix (wHTH) protein